MRVTFRHARTSIRPLSRRLVLLARSQLSGNRGSAQLARGASAALGVSGASAALSGGGATSAAAAAAAVGLKRRSAIADAGACRMEGQAGSPEQHVSFSASTKRASGGAAPLPVHPRAPACAPEGDPEWHGGMQPGCRAAPKSKGEAGHGGRARRRRDRGPERPVAPPGRPAPPQYPAAQQRHAPQVGVITFSWMKRRSSAECTALVAVCRTAHPSQQHRGRCGILERREAVIVDISLLSHCVLSVVPPQYVVMRC